MDYWEQKTAKMFRIAFLLCSSFLWICCNQKTDFQALPYYNEPSFTPVFLNDKADIEKQITHKIDPFSFLNQDSIMVTEKIVKDKIHVANFIFTTCGSICPVMTNHFKIVSDSLKNDKNVILLSYSVTPWIDTPKVLSEYKQNKGIENPNWHFLTGSKDKIYQLARKSYFAEEDLGFSKDNSEFLHTEHCILVDKSGRIRGVYNGTLSLEMKQLIDDIRTLEQED